MNLVDSSGWLEYLADGPAADVFAPALEAVESLLVPAICVTEVFKRVLQQRGVPIRAARRKPANMSLKYDRPR